jgi:hypothetical protein
VDLKVLDDERAVMIGNSDVTIVSILTIQTYIAAAICTENASSEVSMINQLHTSSRACQARLPIVRISCLAQTANLALGEILTESAGPRPCAIRNIMAAIPDCTSAPFSDIPRLREEPWFGLGEITKYNVTSWTQVIGLLKDREETDVLCALKRPDFERLNQVIIALTQSIKSTEGNPVSCINIFPM